MAVFRVERTGDYTVMSNFHLKDKRLSLKAKGLLSQMLSLPDDWDYTLSGLSYINRESKDAIRSAVNELETAGYIRRRQTTDASGKFAANEYTIFERPIEGEPMLDKPLSENPITVNPSAVNPLPENPTQLNTKKSNTQKQNILTGVTTELSTLELQGMKMVDIIINGYAKFIAILLCFLFLSPAAAVVSVVGVAFSALALHGISRHSEKTAAITHQAMEDMSGSAIEYIRGLSIVKSFGQEGASIESFRKANKDLKNIHIKVEKGYTPFNCLHLFSLKLASMGIVFICAWQTLNGQMSLAYFLMFVLFSFVIFGSVENINDAAHMLGLIDSAMNKLESLENAEYIDQDGKDITPASYDITFQDVSFGYDKRTVLHDVNFTIPQNTTTAIVGPSGSGKSTLCSLIARFYDVDAGKITFGGTDIREFTCDSLLKNISMVFQNVYLFRDTIRNNIKFGSPDASEEQIIAAAKKARCHDFIMALPDGYDTVIGEGGSSLSGGEKQRISIARAMLKDAPIVILDEATASIDPENEHLIQEAISALTHGKTIITIAHRLATIENADQILVIDGGTVVQKGTHKELLKQRGTYQDFIRIREQAEGWRIQQ